MRDENSFREVAGNVSYGIGMYVILAIILKVLFIGVVVAVFLAHGG